MGWSRTRIDDLDGSAARPFTFGVDGKAYVLDLGERNRKRIEEILRPFLVVAQEYGELPEAPEDNGVPVVDAEAGARLVSRGHRTPASAKEKKARATEPTSKRRRATALANAKTPTKAAASSRRRRGTHADGRPRDLASVRAWARNNGYSVQNTGRIPNDILEAYDSKTPASV
jgi:hypothetical protein